MTVPDLLLAFMAAAIALAGFAGIVALIDRGAARVAPELASFRVRWLVYSAMWVVILSIAPLLAILSNAPRGVWQYGCIVEAAILLIFMIVTMYNVRRFMRGRALGIRMAGAYLMWLLSLGALAWLVAGGAGVVSASGAYAGGVFWFLLSSLQNFMRLVFSLDEGWRNAARRDPASPDAKQSDMPEKRHAPTPAPVPAKAAE